MSRQDLLDLTSLEAYRRSCLELAGHRLSRFSSMKEIAAAEHRLNAYPGLDRLEEPRDVRLFDDEGLSAQALAVARQAVLDGRLFTEHTAAGEATRLKLGTKFLLNPAKDLTVDQIAALISEQLSHAASAEEVRKGLATEPADLLPLSLGWRHMLQLSYDIHELSVESGREAQEVLGRQKLLVVLNEKTAEQILKEFVQARFFGFSRRGVLFMIQPMFYGIDLKDGRFFYQTASRKRLHNHGQLVMQETMDDQIFTLGASGDRNYLKAAQYGDILDAAADKLSYNIEDLRYLTGAIDWPSLAEALQLGNDGYAMVMEIVANNPKRPQKGALPAFDPDPGRNVMIESFQLMGMPNRELKYLNKNFNHFPSPRISWEALKEKKLFMPLAVKEGYLYFQPVQGDINFLVKTAFVRRREVRPISAWKSVSDTPAAINAMARQDRQPGFKEFVEGVLGRRL
jgi:hypothetical protein